MTKKLSLSEATKLGGLAVKAKYGVEHYSKMGKKSYNSQLKKLGKDHFIKLSKAGLKARLEKAKAKNAEKQSLEQSSNTT